MSHKDDKVFGVGTTTLLGREVVIITPHSMK
jgi:hypothetical protein